MTRASTAARVAAFWALYAAILFVGGLAMGMAPPTGRMLVNGTVVTALTLLLTFAFVRKERSSMAEVGAGWSSGSVRRFGAGFVVGLAMVGLLIALTRVVIGPLEFARNGTVTVSTVALMLITFIALSAGEETGFRGYPFQRLRTAFGIWPAQIVVALAFAAYHVFQGSSLANAIVGAMAGSVLFGVAMLASGGLAFPIGLHAAWNIGEWMLGTKGEVGYWRIDVGAQPSFLVVAAVYLAVMAVTTLAIWGLRSPALVAQQGPPERRDPR